MCQISHVRCLMSHVRCHVLRVMCHVSCVRYLFSSSFLLLFSENVVELVGGGSFINGAYPVYFLPLGKDGVTINSLTDPV